MAGLMRQKAEDNGFISEDFFFPCTPPSYTQQREQSPGKWHIHPGQPRKLKLELYVS